MLCLAIHIYEGGRTEPSPSVRVPLAAVAALARLIPAPVAGRLKARGVDVERVADDAAAKLEPGVLMDIVDEGDRVVIAIERMALGRTLQLTSDAQDA